MSVIREYNWEIGLSPSEGIKTHDDSDAMNQRILEWLNTPTGTVADHPSWGHPLNIYKHDPTSPNLSIIASMAIRKKIIQDIEDLVVGRVYAEFSEIDMMHITIEHANGIFDMRVYV